jgi:hypothetical protein
MKLLNLAPQILGGLGKRQAACHDGLGFGAWSKRGGRQCAMLFRVVARQTAMKASSNNTPC